ncbi:conserved hypothetical protein [Neospora caninum Liverpool]|uniref:Uncharacterized protein n=1 Tax=Neospora caninum (strain Liverpool) TaxID=572307 RepID=F0VQW9_NEOCL|nr:conserved hypothetical protein [Neospora caninum Liverpool]CBZ56116.1 conserved hypothetical protein [Neospora caninum Liverpool]|eukprot:XP_003886142.1 conserved hypothetical protein [Neospora caninum Liverpool]
MPPQLAKIFDRSRDKEASGREEILFTLLRLLSTVRLRQKAARQRNTRATDGFTHRTEGEDGGEGRDKMGDAVAIPGLDRGNLDALDRRIMECIDSWTVPDLGLLLITRRELRDCLSLSKTPGGDSAEGLDQNEENITRTLLRRLAFQRGQPFSQYASLYALQALLHRSKTRHAQRQAPARKNSVSRGEGGSSETEEHEREGRVAPSGAHSREEAEDRLREKENEAFEDADMAIMIIKRVGRNMASCDLEILTRIVNVLSSLPPPKEAARRSGQEASRQSKRFPEPCKSPAEPQGGPTAPLPTAEETEGSACAVAANKTQKAEHRGAEGGTPGDAIFDQKLDKSAAEGRTRDASAALLPNPSRCVAPAGPEGRGNGHLFGVATRGNPENEVSGSHTETQTSFLTDRNDFLYAVAVHIFSTAFADSEKRSASDLATTFASALPPSPCPAAHAPSPRTLSATASSRSSHDSTSSASASASVSLSANRRAGAASAPTPLWASPPSGRVITGDRSWTYSRMCVLLAGLSRTGVTFPPLFYALKPMVVALRLQFPPPMLAALLVAYAHLGAADETGLVDLFGVLGRELVKGVRGMDVAVVGVAANAFANAGVLHQEWFSVVGETFPVLMPLCSPRLLGMIANAYVRLGLVDDPLLPSLFHCARQIGSAYSGFSREAADVVCHALEQEAPQHPVKSQARDFLLSLENVASRTPAVSPSSKLSSSRSESVGNGRVADVSRSDENAFVRHRPDALDGTSRDWSAVEVGARKFFIRGELASTSAFVICYAAAKAKDILGSSRSHAAPGLQLEAKTTVAHGGESTVDAPSAPGREKVTGYGDLSVETEMSRRVGERYREKKEIWQLLLATELTQVVTRFVLDCSSFTELANTCSAVAQFLHLREEMLSRDGREQESLQRGPTARCQVEHHGEENLSIVTEANGISTDARTDERSRFSERGSVDPSIIRQKMANYLLSACEAFFHAVENHLGSFRTLKSASLGPPELHKLICAFHAFHRAERAPRVTARRMVVLERLMCDNSDMFHEMTLLPLRQMAAAVSYLGMDNDDIIETLVMLQQKRKKKKAPGLLAAPALLG